MSIWRGVGWVLGVALAGMVPQAHERIERWREPRELVELPALDEPGESDEDWDEEHADRGWELEDEESGVRGGGFRGILGGAAGTAKGKKPAAKPKPKAAPAKKPATRNREAVQSPKAPAKPRRGRPPLNDGLTPAERRAAREKREAMLARLAKGRATAAANRAAKQGAK